MLIKRLKLRNIRSYVDEEITFPEGSVLLSGDIGSGKSSLLYAIEFALFGSDTERLSGGALLRKGAVQGEVALTFELDGQEITVERGLKQGSKSIGQTPGAIILDGKRKEAMPSELKADIIALLGYPEELITKKQNLTYRYTVYCPQEEMKAILTDEQESRLDTLRRIFGIDRYKRIQENAATVARELRSMKRELEARTEGLEEKKRQLAVQQGQERQLHERLAAVVPLIQQLEEELAKQRKALQDAEQQLNEVQGRKKRLGVLEAQGVWMQQLLGKNGQRLQQLRELLGRLERLQVSGDSASLQREIEQRETRLQQLVESRTRSEQRLASITERCAELERELSVPEPDAGMKQKRFAQLAALVAGKAQIEQGEQQLQAAIEQLRAVLREHEVKREQAAQLRTQILTLAECPTCLQPVSKEHKAHVHEKEGEKAQLFAAKAAESQRLVAQNEQELASLRGHLRALREAEKELAGLRAELAHLEQQHAEREQKRKALQELKIGQARAADELAQARAVDLEQERAAVKQLRQQLDQLRERERSLNEEAELARGQQQLAAQREQLLQEHAMLERQAVQDAVFEKHVAEQRAALDKLSAEERTLSIDQSALETQRDGIGRTVRELAKEIAEKEALRKSAERIAQLHQWLDAFFISLMGTIEKHVLLRIHHEFNALFQEWFGMLMEDEQLSARIDDQFAPAVEQQGYAVDVAYLSGGERTSAALAYRLALNKVVNDTIQTIRTRELLILDEPTDGFSTEQLDRVRIVLEQLGLRQVIIVSHEEKIASFVQQVMRVVKEGGVSRLVG